MSDTAKLELEGKTLELPIITGSEGEKAIDIRQLRANTGFVTLDNGFMNSGSCESAITFLNGEKGILRYRGYPIEQLADSSSFVEVAYLLTYGNLPTQEQLNTLDQKIKNIKQLPEGLLQLIQTFPKDAHPMGAISSAMVALSAYHPELEKSDMTAEEMDNALPLLMGYTKLILGAFYRHAQGKAPLESSDEKDYASDFLNLMFNGPGANITPAVAKALDVLLILHADHEQNCSASTVRVVGSGQANIFASIASGINALWGKLHGGANQAVLEMLQEIQENGGDYKLYLAKAKDKNDPFRLMGFGHRVYKNFDPRAKIIKKACNTVLEQLGVEDPLLDIAKGLEEEALKDEYFVKRNLYPNVDFYSGIIYRALGIPTNLFTGMFVLGRLPGWMAQWRELRETPGTKISRPRQIYTGSNERDYRPISER